VQLLMEGIDSQAQAECVLELFCGDGWACVQAESSRK
jgi:hypothetical protein